MEKYIRNLTTNESLFKVDPGNFAFDKNTYKKVASAALQLDPNLTKMRIKFVPLMYRSYTIHSRLSEEKFWTVYVYLINVIKTERQIHRLDDKLAAMAKSVLMWEREKIKEMENETKEALVLISRLRGNLEKVITLAKMKQVQPVDLELDRDIQDLFTRKKKLSIIASDMSYDETFIDTLASLEKPFSECVRLWEEYEELKSSEKILKDEQYFTPKLLGMKRDDPILSELQRMEICRVIPYRFKNRNWNLVYSSKEHGTLLNTLYSRMDDQGPFILIGKTATGEVFGAYLAILSLAPQKGYYGGGETFVFHYIDGKLVHYQWSKKNKMIVLSRETSLYIGGGEDSKAAIYIDEDIQRGSSGPCETFDSPALTDPKDFQLYHIALWCFEFKQDELGRKQRQEIRMVNVVD